MLLAQLHGISVPLTKHCVQEGNHSKVLVPLGVPS